MATTVPAERVEAQMEFVAAFEGPALEAGRMSARQLAPSLFALAELVERSATLVFASADEQLRLEVKADFRQGSFEFHPVVVLAATAGETLYRNLSLADVDVLLQWIGLKGGLENSLFGFLLRHGDKQITSVEPAPEAGTVNITIHGDNASFVFNAPTAVGRMLTDNVVRQSVRAIAEPLKDPGIERFRAGTYRHPTELVISKPDLPNLDAMPIEEELSDSTAPSAVEVIAPAFIDENKWRVAQGGEAFFVAMKDRAFIAKINAGEPFSKGDVLIVELRTRVVMRDGQLKSEREIVKVLDHRHRVEQQSLF